MLMQYTFWMWIPRFKILSELQKPWKWPKFVCNALQDHIFIDFVIDKFTKSKLGVNIILNYIMNDL